MSELKKKCFWAHQQLTVTTTTTTTGKKILFLFKISYFPSCSNMNMNGRRIFKMIQDFAYNVAENFGIYDMNDNEISGGNDPTDTKQRITEIGGHIPIFGRPETVFDPNTSKRSQFCIAKLPAPVPLTPTLPTKYSSSSEDQE